MTKATYAHEYEKLTGTVANTFLCRSFLLLLCMAFVTVVLACACVALPRQAFAADLPSYKSENVFVYDASSERELISAEADERVAVASMTKVVTAITALDMITNLDDTVTITSSMLSNVAWDEMVAGISAGDVLTYRDLLYGMLLPSGGDCAAALACSLSGSIDAFAQKMNSKAKSLGMTNSHFVNVSGIEDDEHYSTVRDIAIAFSYGLKNETFKEVVSTPTYTLTSGLYVGQGLASRANKSGYSNVDRILGGKTGYTTGAGYCLVSYFESGGETVITCTAGAETSNNIIYDALVTIYHVDGHYAMRTLVKEGTVLESVEVLNGMVDSFDIVASGNACAFVPDDYENNLEVTFDILPIDASACPEGDKVGTVNYYLFDVLLATEDVILTAQDITAIQGKTYGSQAKSSLSSYIMVAILAAIFLLGIIAVVVLVTVSLKRKRVIAFVESAENTSAKASAGDSAEASAEISVSPEDNPKEAAQKRHKASNKPALKHSSGKVKTYIKK